MVPDACAQRTASACSGVNSNVMALYAAPSPAPSPPTDITRAEAQSSSKLTAPPAASATHTTRTSSNGWTCPATPSADWLWEKKRR